MVHPLREALLNYGHHPSRKFKNHVSNRVNEPSDPVKFSELPKEHVSIDGMSQVIPSSFRSFLSALYLKRDILLSTVSKIQKSCQQSGE